MVGSPKIWSAWRNPLRIRKSHSPSANFSNICANNTCFCKIDYSNTRKGMCLLVLRQKHAAMHRITQTRIAPLCSSHCKTFYSMVSCCHGKHCSTADYTLSSVDHYALHITLEKRHSQHRQPSNLRALRQSLAPDQQLRTYGTKQL